MNIREDFCGVCMAVPLAVAGFGATSFAATGVEFRKKRKMIIIGCVVVILMSSFLLWRSWGCRSCSA